MPRPIPFSLDHTASANLSAQLADGLRDAIVSGYYRKGETLPTIVELARALGTSVQVPRKAIAALSSENLVSPRRGVGCVVVGRRQSVWKGRVLGIVPAEREGAPAFRPRRRRPFPLRALTVSSWPQRGRLVE